MTSPNFIIHASGSLGGMPDLGKKAYRLHCRFTVGAYPSYRVLEKAKYRAAELFVRDMAKQGFQYVDRHGMTMVFRGASVQVMNLGKPKRPPSSRQMLPHVMQGAKFRSEWEPPIQNALLPSETESWDYELSAVFVHDTILMDVPGRHEELHG